MGFREALIAAAVVGLSLGVYIGAKIPASIFNEHNKEQ